jgi:hypothetical protein
VLGVAVTIGINGNGQDSSVLGGPDDSDRNLTTVGDQKFFYLALGHN